MHGQVSAPIPECRICYAAAASAAAAENKGSPACYASNQQDMTTDWPPTDQQTNT
jgi:hypothetical protein